MFTLGYLHLTQDLNLGIFSCVWSLIYGLLLWYYTHQWLLLLTWIRNYILYNMWDEKVIGCAQPELSRSKRQKTTQVGYGSFTSSPCTQFLGCCGTYKLHIPHLTNHPSLGRCPACWRKVIMDWLAATTAVISMIMWQWLCIIFLRYFIYIYIFHLVYISLNILCNPTTDRSWLFHVLALQLVMPPPLAAGGIMFSGCPSVRSLKYPLLTCTWVHWSTRPTVTVLRHVRPSGEISGHLPENAWREWPEILHADVSWPSSELISLWPRSVDFSNFGTILT